MQISWFSSCCKNVISVLSFYEYNFPSFALYYCYNYAKKTAFHSIILFSNTPSPHLNRPQLNLNRLSSIITL